MRTALATLTLAALLVAQLCVAASRGLHICISTDELSSHECSEPHEHEHSGAFSPVDHNAPCDHCFHVATPDDLQATRARPDLHLELLGSPSTALIAAWAFPVTVERDTSLSWAVPPPDPGALAHVRALSVTRLLI